MKLAVINALINQSRRTPNLKNRVDSKTEQAVLKYAIDFPAHGQVRTSNELRKLGGFISPSGVRSIWLSNDLENFKKRLVALEKQVAENGIILTEEQVAALDRKKHDDEACGEIETAHQSLLTDRGTGYCGRVDQHDYQLYLAINDIDHRKTKAMSPQTNGICESFHKTILNEFYQITFRKKLYGSMEEFQKDLDEWMCYYNDHRTHQGKKCCGRTPIETLEDGKTTWAEKNLAQI